MKKSMSFWVMALSVLIACKSNTSKDGSENTTDTRNGNTTGTAPPTNKSTSDDCDCKMQFLYYKEQREGSNSNVTKGDLPQGKLYVKGFSPTGELDLGTYVKEVNQTYKLNLEVAEGSDYEVNNTLTNLFCTRWIELCERGDFYARDKLWEEIVAKWKEIYRPEIDDPQAAIVAPEKEQKISPPGNLALTQIPAGLSILTEGDDYIRFTYGYHGNKKAYLRVLVYYPKSGQPVCHHQDVIIRLPSKSVAVIDLQDLGIYPVPDTWSVGIELYENDRKTKTLRSVYPETIRIRTSGTVSK